MESQVTVADNSSNGFRRGKSKTDGGRNVGSRQKWIPSESSSSRADGVKKGQDAGVKTFGEKTGKKPSVSFSDSQESSRAWSKVHNIDTKPNQSPSTGGNSSNTSNAGIAGGGSGRKATEQSFVAYLPQDDVVMEVFETQEVIDLLNKQLSALLRLPYRQFWEKVSLDDSLSVFLDSYLQYRKRWFDIPMESSNTPEVNIVVGDGDLSRRVFMVLLRLSSKREPGVADSESLTAKEHGGLLKERQLFDVPKLMDISAIYGHDNPALTQRLVRNVFDAQTEYVDELIRYVPPLLERITTVHKRCSETVETVAMHQLSSGTEKDSTGLGDQSIVPGADRVFEELLEIVDYLNDVIFTLSAFILAFPSAASILILVTSGYSNSGSDQGLFPCAFASLHDILLPKLREGFLSIISSLSKEKEKEQTAAFSCSMRLERLRKRLVYLGWLLIEPRYFRNSSQEDPSITPSQFDADDVIVKSDSLVQELVALAIGLPDDSSNSGFACTGSLLRSMERKHGLSYHIEQACQKGALVLDDAQKDYISALLVDDQPQAAPPSGPKQENVLRLTYPEKGADEETVIRQSRISQVKDIFPDFGDGFIDACLEAYDNDPENVIQRILEGTLHPELKELKTSLPAKPADLAKTAPVKDKGKGKIIENDSVRVDKPSAATSSAFPVGGSSSSSSAVSRGKAPVSDVSIPEENAGRYVRRQKEDAESFSDLLDTRRNGGDDLRRAIKAAAARVEYEDEYDDSFDELGYMADAGGIEETESLADFVGSRGNNSQARNSGRPFSLTPWGAATNSRDGKSSETGPSGRGDPSSGERQHPAADGLLGKFEHQREEKGERGQLRGGFKNSPEPSREDIRLPSFRELGISTREETQGRDKRFVAGAGNVNSRETHRGERRHSAGAPDSYERQRQYQPLKEPEAQKRDKLDVGSRNKRDKLDVGSSSSIPSDSSQGYQFWSPVSEKEGQTDETSTGRGRGGRGGRGRSKNRGPQPKSEIYLRDGKIYNFKVAGGIGVGSIEEAEAIRREETETIFGLGKGGNVPKQQEGNETSGKQEGSDSAGRGDRGRGRGRGRGDGRGRGRGGYDNHHRKDKAMQKHFSGLGG